MVVAPPSRRADGIYSWANDAAIAPAPGWLLDMVAERPRPHRARGEAEQVHWALVAETVKHVPCELEWQERNTIGMAIWACTGGPPEGFLIWDEWLRRSGKYNARTTRQRWAAIGRCPPNDLGYGTLEYRANRADPNWWNEFEREVLKHLNK
jgi:hypothetical protein